MLHAVEIGTYLAACAGGVITFICSHRALKQSPLSDAALPIAVVTAVLSVVGLLSVGSIILVPFIALPLSLLVILICQTTAAQRVAQHISQWLYPRLPTIHRQPTTDPHNQVPRYSNPINAPVTRNQMPPATKTPKNPPTDGYIIKPSASNDWPVIPLEIKGRKFKKQPPNR
jgi:hypothetical protein